MRSITSLDTIKVLNEIFSRLGYPATLTCDNGNQFTSEVFDNYYKECGTTLYHTVPYWPQMNGEVERQNRDVLKRVKISQAENRNWKEGIFNYIMVYNGTPHAVTGKSSSELLCKRPNMQYKTIDKMWKEKWETEEMKEKGKEYTDLKRKASVI